MPEFLIALGNLDKDTDDLRDSSFTTYEVRLFMRMFNIKDQKGVHDGFLTYAELVNLFDVDLYLEPDVKKNIKNELNSGDSINALKFLTTILKHKSKGNGLDKTQIMKVIRLYKPISGYFDDSYQQEFYNKLNIVSKDYKKLLEFEHVQPPALELQEFLVFWAEYNTEDHGNSRFFSSSDVRDFIYEFNLYDRKSDGVITFEEFKPIARTYFNEDYKCCFGKTVFDQYTGNQPEMNAAMFLNMKYYLVFNGQDAMKM
ncbi:uncharacterized protein LOC126836982 [Adelges cooleyi]|uniref:uncharacterized protein LOC126836982 n=1 Tax=Adelges cooleyi TaxID=133065 RepID=UPI00217FD079|nr:uncharacterized protein LOC126836982 [Adelges cooleyi]